MRLDASVENAEQSLIHLLESNRVAIDDRTGKGSMTEVVVQDHLIVPNLPPELRCCKGSVVQASAPAAQSPAIDRVIYNPTNCGPLVYRPEHSIFPIETVCGLVEITIDLDATKLREDIERMAPVKAMRERGALIPTGPVSATAVTRESLSPRSYVIGLPRDRNWSPQTIADALRRIQRDMGPPTHVHLLYVIGIGCFYTVPVDTRVQPPQEMFRVRGWSGQDRMFRFAIAFRQGLDSWLNRESADLYPYLPGEPNVDSE